TKRLLLVIYSLELSGYDKARAKLFHQRLLERLAALPGVQMVSPDHGYEEFATIALPAAKQIDRALYRWAPSNYLETLGTPLGQGRGFTDEGTQAKAPVVIVSETTAGNLWPNEIPLGKTLRLARSLRDGGRQIIFPAAQVIGVARDAQSAGVGSI